MGSVECVLKLSGAEVSCAVQIARALYVIKVFSLRPWSNFLGPKFCLVQGNTHGGFNWCAEAQTRAVHF